MSALVFLGSPVVSARCLRAVHEAGHDVRLVVTEPDRRRGRGGALLPTPVKQLACELGIPVTERVRDVLAVGAELGVIVAFGRLVKADVLSGLPMVNLHFSLLPRWRGAAPVERAILAGDEETGVCLMEVEAGLDTGGVYDCRRTQIGPHETAAELTGRLGEIGAALLVERLAAGLGRAVPQEGEPTYAAKLSPEELALDFARPALELERLVRVGRAWTSWRGGRLLVHRAVAAPGEAALLPPGTLSEGRVATGGGFLVPLEVQPEGRKRQDFSEWLRGARPVPGERFGLSGSPAGGTVA